MLTSVEGKSPKNPFTKGAKVEASLDEEGFRGSWYTATVLRPPPKRISTTTRIPLLFDTLITKGDGEESAAAEPLRESVRLILVRPVPPRESRRSFRVSEDVDAFHNDGWWEGVVVAVLGEDRYSIFFRSSREQIDFHESQLRLHREWVHGEWVPPLEAHAGAPVQLAPPK
ncbi:agenet domain-containing protein [Striga hermonthica]|uniref:Agenet domain-containing protein n=1 Tax=Striga hermonthica TaxID=68872 RepID=A0A9N7RBX7_STRHE|nr:agenet domain-containing protein [Striga hermonthica]